MKFQFNHKAFSSLIPWMDYVLVNSAEAYNETTGVLTKYTDSELPDDYSVFGSKIKGWVYDSSIDGISAPSIWEGSQQVTEGTSGAIFDYENGRVIFAGNEPNTDTLTGTFFAREVNVYPTNEAEEDLVIEKKYEVNAIVANSSSVKPDYATPYDPTVPAIFVNIERGNNKPFAFGGEKETVLYAKGVVIAPDSYYLDGILSAFQDNDTQSVPLLEESQLPLTYFGGVQSGYSYQTLWDNRNTGVLLHIENITHAKLSESIRKETSSNFYVGFIDIDMRCYRYT